MSTDRDKRLQSAEQKIRRDAERGGFSKSRAKQIARDAVEKADATKKKLGHW